MKTMKQLSEKYNISRASLIRRMNKIHNFSDYVQRDKNGKMYISEAGEKLINYPKHNSTTVTYRKKHGQNKHEVTKQKLLESNHRKDKIIESLVKSVGSLRNSYKQLANRPSDNQKRLSGQKSKSQPKLNDPWTKKMNKNQKIIQRLTNIKDKQDIDDWVSRHRILAWLVKHRK